MHDIILDFFSFCSSYDLTLIRKSHTLNYYLFLLKFLLFPLSAALYCEHIMKICFSSKFALRIPSVLPSFRPAIWCVLSSLFPREVFWLSLKYLQIIMRQCAVKPAWIGHALKRIPCWQGQTCFIPSFYYMLSFHAFLKHKKATCLTRTQLKILGISNKEGINVHFCQFF